MVNLNPFSKRIKYLKDNGKPQTFVRVGESKSQGLTSKEERKQKDLKDYWLYYQSEGNVFASLNVTTWNTVMTGYTIDGDNEEAVKEIQNLLDNIILEDALLDAVLFTLIFGDGFIEKIRYRDGEIARLKVIDSRTMVIDYDKFGDIQSYHQEIGGRSVGKKLKPEDIIHIRFFPFPSNPYGVSMIAPNRETIDRKISTDISLYNAIRRHGTKKWVATVGTEKDGQIPPDSVMDDIRDKLEDIESKNEFVVPWMITLETIDEKGIQGVEEYFNYFQTQLTVGLLCPEEALGLGKGSTEATARQKAIMYERMIKAFQHKISNILKRSIIDEHLILKKYIVERKGEKIIPDTVKLKFKPVTEEDEALRAKWWSNIVRGFQGRIPFTGNEFRSMFGYEPIEGLDDVLMMTVQEDTAETQSQDEEDSTDEENQDEEGKDELEEENNEETENTK